MTADSIIVVLESSYSLADLSRAVSDASSILRPLLDARAIEKTSAEALRPLAKTLGPVVTGILKATGARLSEPHLNPDQLWAIGEAAALALSALDNLRPVLKASPQELDTQRYNIVRKMMAQKLFSHALAQGLALHTSVARSAKATNEPSDLHCAAVASLLLCYSEIERGDHDDASQLWGDVCSALDSLLCLARESSCSKATRGRMLDPVLKCIVKVVEKLLRAEASLSLPPPVIAQQLLGLLACGSACQQEQAVQQLLFEEAPKASQEMQLHITNALLSHISATDSLPDTLRVLLHQLTVGLAQKRAGPLLPFDAVSVEEHPVAVALRSALELSHCLQKQEDVSQVASIVGRLSLAVESLGCPLGSQGRSGSRWLRWVCMDVLRISVAGNLSQLLSNPHAAGGRLLVVAQCMELLAQDSLELEKKADRLETSVVPSGASGAVLAVRLAVAHRTCTGQLAGLHADVSRLLHLMHELLKSAHHDQNQSAHGSDADDAVAPAVLQSLSASLSNAGLDLLQAQHCAPAAELLHAAAVLALRRASHLGARDSAPAGAELIQLVKKCKAHVTALAQLEEHGNACQAAAQYITRLHPMLQGNPHHVSCLVKLHVRAQLAACAAIEESAAKAASAVSQPALLTNSMLSPVASVPAGPAAPVKAGRRGGRLQRMKADNAEALPVISGRTPTTADQQHVSGRAVNAVAAAARTGALVPALSAAACGSDALEGLLDELDVFALLELEVAAEECQRRELQGGPFQQAHSEAVLGAVSTPGNSGSGSLRRSARALLVRALTAADAGLAEQITMLESSCKLFDEQIGNMQELGIAGVSCMNLGLLDSAALAHAQLAVCQAQHQLAHQAARDNKDALEHASQAVHLWRQLLQAQPDCSSQLCILCLRLPQSTLHAILQLQQLLNLYTCSHPQAKAVGWAPVMWGLVRAFAPQVKLRDQYTYMLCASLFGSSCLSWALGPQPQPALAEAMEARAPARLQEVLAVMQPMRSTGTLNHCTLAMAAEACGEELEHSGFLRHGPAPLLLRAQCHQVAAEAHLRAGDTTKAYVQAQEGLRITCALFAGLACSQQEVRRTEPGSEVASSQRGTVAQPPQSAAEVAAAAVQSGAAANIQDYTVQDDENGGLADVIGSTAPRPSQGEPGVTATSADASFAVSGQPKPARTVDTGFAWAIASSHLASLHLAARVFEAAGSAEDASCLWRECSRTAETFGVMDMQVLSCCHLADLCCRRGDAAAAQAYLRASDEGMNSLLASAIADSNDTAELKLLQAQVQATRARLCLVRREYGAAEAASRKGLTLCDVVAGCGGVHDSGSAFSSCSSSWPALAQPTWLAWSMRCLLSRLCADVLMQQGRHAVAAEELQSALDHLSQRAFADCCATYVSLEAEVGGVRAVWPVDSGLLLAHATAAASRALPQAAPGANAFQGACVVGLRSSTATGYSCGTLAAARGDVDADEESDNRLAGDQAARKGARAMKGKGTSKKQQQQQSIDGQQRSLPQSISSIHGHAATALPALLVSLQLCWQVPLAAVHACRQLMHACMQLELPHAAAMFLHLGQGMSYPQQQALHREMRLRAGLKGGSGGSPRRAQESSRASCSSGISGCGMASSPCASASSKTFNDVRECALQLLSRLCPKDGANAWEDVGIRNLAALESGAAEWLQRSLDALPCRGALVASIMEDGAGGLVLARVCAGRQPLLVRLQAGKAEAGGRASLQDCMDRLGELQNASSDSMRADQDTACSQSQKAQWWKLRVSLDERMRDLLRAMDDDCLGAWRCLLLPMPKEHAVAVYAASEAFATQHVLSVAAAQEESGDSAGTSIATCTAVVRELLAAVLSAMGYLQRSDVCVILRILCSASGPSDDAASVSALADQLQATEAALRIDLLRLPVSVADGQLGNLAAEEGASRVSEPVLKGPAATSGTRRKTAAAGGTDTVQPRARATAGAARARATGTAAASRPPVSCAPEGPPEAAASEAPGKSRRAPRLVAMRPEVSSQAATAKSTGRAAPRAGRARTGAGAAPSTEQEPCVPAPARAAAGAAARTCTTSAESEHADPGDSGCHREEPVLVLQLGHALHALPWESMPCLRGRSVYRMLNLAAACTPAAEDAASPPTASLSPTLASGPSAFYVLNPSGDLEDTQRCFQPLLAAQPGWQGLVGEAPSSRALLAALQAHDLFLYFGHGSGEQYLPLPSLRKAQRCAAAVLMGCSSGRLRLHGDYDPAGAVVAYILAGCPELVANLWDVTDRDIDRYAATLLAAWPGCVAAAAAEGEPGPAKALSEAQQPSGGSVAVAGSVAGSCLGMAVARSRGACKLPHLIGGAPVCYGLPRLRAGHT